MRRSLGLASPERRIGQAAHDFAQAWCSAPQLMLTRALRVEGAPTVPSRWLLRLDSLLRLIGIEPETLHAGIWLGWQAELDQPGPVVPARPPAPRPPVAARPQRLSVTEIETWIRDPYAIYARRILRLDPLDPIDADPNAADRGSFIHEALEKFVKAFPDGLPADAKDRLLELGRQAFGESLDRPSVRAFWWPRFERIARWYIAEERVRAADILDSSSEKKGSLVLAAPGGPFTITAVADRIDRLHSGGLVLIDYKTGVLPTRREIENAIAVQLPLEGAIARDGSFEGLSGTAAALEYWRLPGGDPAGIRTPIAGDDPRALIDKVIAKVAALVDRFDDPHTPYVAVPEPQLRPRFSDYAHLERLDEAAFEP
jgi:ATP-dependent helicase/nuclease subunit B